MDGTTSFLSTSGTNADDVIQARGDGYFIGTNLTPLYQYDEVNPNGIFFGVGAGFSRDQTAITGVTELTDSSLATALLTITASYMQAPMTWLKPTVGTGTHGAYVLRLRGHHHQACVERHPGRSGGVVTQLLDVSHPARATPNRRWDRMVKQTTQGHSYNATRILGMWVPQEMFRKGTIVLIMGLV